MKNDLLLTVFGKRERGFTLIELLIVIAMIGVLSTILMVNFVGIRERARDARRKNEIRQIQTALELYRSDVGSYPATGVVDNNCGNAFTSLDGSATYMTKLPCDPLGGSYQYDYDGTTGRYTLYACIENSNDSEKAYPTPGDCPIAAYVVTNP